MSSLPPTNFRLRQNTDEVAESGQESELAIASFIRPLRSSIKLAHFCILVLSSFSFSVVEQFSIFFQGENTVLESIYILPRALTLETVDSKFNNID